MNRLFRHRGQCFVQNPLLFHLFLLCHLTQGFFERCRLVYDLGFLVCPILLVRWRYRLRMTLLQCTLITGRCIGFQDFTQSHRRVRRRR
uniref:Putative secreted protein n=1 Tax=Anopheles darlingi TaxID=43151 RepID=A0A2M4DNC4_ANODA